MCFSAREKLLNSIIKHEGNFVVQLHANQGELYKHVQPVFAEHYNDQKIAEYIEKSSGNGRKEVRRVRQINADLPAEIRMPW